MHTRNNARGGDKKVIFLSPYHRKYLRLLMITIMNHVRRSSMLWTLIVGAMLGYFLCSLRQPSYDYVEQVFGDNDQRMMKFHAAPLAKDRIDLPVQVYFTYLQEYQTQIDGWFSREILYVIWTVVQYQYTHLNIAGGIGEIGVHHGKFTCFLYLMRKFREQRLFAVDVFDNQALNKDGSGRGQKDAFLNSIRKYSDVHENEVALYAGSSLDLNPTFLIDKRTQRWWWDEVVGKRGLQLVSIDGGHTSLLTYSDLCVVSNSVIDGAVVVVDDITHPGWLGVRDGTGRFLSETSALLTDYQLENEMAQMPNQTRFELSQRIVNATNLNEYERKRSPCARLVPFLQFSNKLFLTTPNYYPHYIDLLGAQENFANDARSRGIFYLEYHALRLTIGNVPIWTDNHDYNITHKDQLFKELIEPKWLQQMQLRLTRPTK